MKLADGLFLESCREVSTQYPAIEYNEIIVDNCCMQLVSKPEQFDVMVCTFFPILTVFILRRVLIVQAMFTSIPAALMLWYYKLCYHLNIESGNWMCLHLLRVHLMIIWILYYFILTIQMIKLLSSVSFVVHTQWVHFLVNKRIKCTISEQRLLELCCFCWWYFQQNASTSATTSPHLLLPLSLNIIHCFTFPLADEGLILCFTGYSQSLW